MRRWIERSVRREWRGGVAEPRPIETWRSAASLFDPLIRELGLEERVCELEIVGAWRDVVGDCLAAHTQPSGLRDGVLQVRVLQPSLRFELERSWKPEILRKLRQKLGHNRVRDIRFGLT